MPANRTLRSGDRAKITLRGGWTIEGLVRSAGPREVTLRDAEGKLQYVPASWIVGYEKVNVPVKVRLDMTLRINPEAWVKAFDVEPGKLRPHVRGYVMDMVNKHLSEGGYLIKDS